MKVCWFSNVPFPSACRAAGIPAHVVGGWLPSLADALVATGEVELLVVSFVPGGSDKTLQMDGITHEIIAVEPKRFAKEAWFYPSPRLRQKCCKIVAGFEADLIHINGTEYGYGLLVSEGDIRLPAVISLQGMLEGISRNCWGQMSFLERLASQSVRDLIRGDGPGHVRRSFMRRAREVEERILRSRAVFCGRTRFDRAYLRRVNRSATYCQCDRVLRAPFYATVRDPKAVRHSIFTCASSYPFKGFHCLLRAVAQLKPEYPDIAVRIPGHSLSNSLLGKGYPRYLYKLIRSLGLADHVVTLGQLHAEAVARELAQAHVFAMASFVDNSPNSLAEAMLVGTPAVATFAGGIPSMVKDGETALCFPTGDEVVMAECLRMIFADDRLAQGLARNARDVALERHDPQRIAHRMLDIYAAAVAGEKASRGGGSLV